MTKSAGMAFSILRLVMVKSGTHRFVKYDQFYFGPVRAHKRTGYSNALPL